MIKTRYDLLLKRLEPALISESLKNAREIEISSQEMIDMFFMGIVFQRNLSLLRSGDVIDQAAIERTAPSDEEIAELEQMAEWIIKKYQTSDAPEI